MSEPPVTTPRRGRRGVITVAALGAVGLAGVGVLGAGGAFAAPAASGTGSSAYVQPAYNRYGGHGFGGGYGSYDGGSTATGTGTGTATATSATSAQQVGVVDIVSTLGYQNAKAAGTGMVLTADGLVLTNNHVVAGATSLAVTVVSSGATFTATVVGTDPSADVAVLRLANASRVATATLSTSPASLGEAVTAVGNAGGTGTLSAAAGTVTALGQAITASDESGASSEQLSGLIETDAGVQAGDSGGPLYDAAGAIVGMDTAASSGGAVQAYAIPISTALGIATQIEQGVTSTTIQQGYPAFLGVSVGDGQGGATVQDVVSGGAADSAGITAGDVITAVGGRSVTAAADLTAALASHSPGQRVTVTWTDAGGSVHRATTTLGTGPAR